MPKKYIKQVKVVNKEIFDQLSIDPTELSLSQRNYTDKLIEFLRPIRRSYYAREEFERIVLNFVEVTRGLNKDKVRRWFTTYTTKPTDSCQCKERRDSIIDEDALEILEKKRWKK